MMPPALQGSASTGASKNTGTPARSEVASGGSRQDFDALLKGDTDTAASAPARPAGKPGKPEAAAKPRAETDPGAATDAAKRPAADDGSEPSTDPATAGTPTSKAGTADAADETEPAPWPPLGLAGLALAGATPAIPAPVPAVPVADTDPLPAPATTAPALPLAAVGAAAAEPGAVSGAAAAITLPPGTEAPVSADDVPMLKLVTDALASSDGGEAPAASLLHALHAAAELKSSAVTAAFTGSPTATPDVGADDFGDAMSARIGWLADQKIGHAVIRVTPHDLGQIEVRLQIDGDKVHASFSSAHAEVRHALESNMPRLREMLGEQGFQLGNADVGQQHTAQDGQAGGGQSGAAGGDGEPALTEVTVSPGQLMRQRGLVDAYA
ncbi:flagellar hook-length control protein FliK [Bacillus subtilis subsp. subtilis]|nr:flagellar hook-length control protein FliK [Bacillus subtilis subsp. subtilis]